MYMLCPYLGFKKTSDSVMDITLKCIEKFAAKKGMRISHNSKSIKIAWHHRFKRDLLPPKKGFGITAD